MYYHLTETSRNQKTGPIPVATISPETCPDSCPLKNGGGCYAEAGPLALHWRSVGEGKRGESFTQFLRRVRNLPRGIWRYGQAGDLPGEGDQIDREDLLKLAEANRERPVIAFTHKPMTPENLKTLKLSEDRGFHVNASADDIEEADKLLDLGLSVVVVLASCYGRKQKKGIFNETLTEYRERLKGLPKTTPNGTRIAVCPATYSKTTCQKCGICAAKRKNNVVVGFPAHGTKVKTIDRRLEVNGPASL